MEIETAARRHLLGFADVTAYVQKKVFKHSLLERVDGTSGRAIVVRRSNGWGQPDPVQTAEFPILVVDFWADPDRDADGQKVEDNAIDKAYAVYRAVDPLLHAVRDQWWGAGGTNPGLWIVNCARYAEPFHQTIDDVHGSGPVAGNQPIGEEACVTVQYAVTLVHTRP